MHLLTFYSFALLVLSPSVTFLPSLLLLEPFHFQDLISNSPCCLSHNSYEVSRENLVLDQLIIP